VPSSKEFRNIGNACSPSTENDLLNLRVLFRTLEVLEGQIDSQRKLFTTELYGTSDLSRIVLLGIATLEKGSRLFPIDLELTHQIFHEVVSSRADIARAMVDPSLEKADVGKVVADVDESDDFFRIGAANRVVVGVREREGVDIDRDRPESSFHHGIDVGLHDLVLRRDQKNFHVGILHIASKNLVVEGNVFDVERRPLPCLEENGFLIGHTALRFEVDPISENAVAPRKRHHHVLHTAVGAMNKCRDRLDEGVLVLDFAPHDGLWLEFVDTSGHKNGTSTAMEHFHQLHRVIADVEADRRAFPSQTTEECSNGFIKSVQADPFP